MDAGIIDENGCVYVMARDDDVINVAGHRISTSALEEIILEHPLVVDAAVVGVPDSLKGQLPLALYVIKPEAEAEGKILEEQITKELIQQVRNNIGPVAAFKLAVKVPSLPRTRSGKTPRQSISNLAQDKIVQVNIISDLYYYD
jgi:propionyl-CoA synthetase